MAGEDYTSPITGLTYKVPKYEEPADAPVAFKDFADSITVGGPATREDAVLQALAGDQGLTWQEGMALSVVDAVPDDSVGEIGDVVFVTGPGSGSPLPGVGGGKVLQVEQTVKTDVFTSSSTSMVDVNGLSVSITPSDSNSKVLIMCSFVIGSEPTNTIEANLVRDSTDIAQSTGGSTNQTLITQSEAGAAVSSSIIFLDFPTTTSPTTYKIQARNASAGPFYIGRSSTGSIRAAISTITAMEVSA